MVSGYTGADLGRGDGGSEEEATEQATNGSARGHQSVYDELMIRGRGDKNLPAAVSRHVVAGGEWTKRR